MSPPPINGKTTCPLSDKDKPVVPAGYEENYPGEAGENAREQRPLPEISQTSVANNEILC